MIPLKDLRAEYREVGAAVQEVLSQVIASQRFVHGPHVGGFERAWAAEVGALRCVGCSSGTVALELILRALNLPRGSAVVVPAISFVATAEAVVNVGLRPVFADVDPATGNIEPLMARAAAIEHRAVACIAVALHGTPLDLPAMLRHLPAGCELVLDLAQAHGGTAGGQLWGSFGLPAAWSFYPGKPLGAWGDAGAVTCNDDGLAGELLNLRDHGRLGLLGSGGNWRMDEIQAAVLRAKLPALSRWRLLRDDAALRYQRSIVDAGLDVLLPEWHRDPSWHVYPVQVNANAAVAEKMQAQGVDARPHYPYSLPELLAFGRAEPAEFPRAHEFTCSTLSLPMFPQITAEQQGKVVEALAKALEVTHGDAGSGSPDGVSRPERVGS